jgi:hypothetical protein
LPRETPKVEVSKEKKKPVKDASEDVGPKIDRDETKEAQQK